MACFLEKRASSSKYTHLENIPKRDILPALIIGFP